MAEAAENWKYRVDEPVLTDVVTEDDAPVDNLFSERQQRLSVSSLYASGQQFRPFVAMANVGLFFSPDEQPYVPDVLVSLGVQPPDDVWEKRNRSYFIWRYGKPPEVVVEIVSNREQHEERKILGYARCGIAYYIIYDPGQFLSQRKLRVYELHGSTYVPLADPRRLPSLPLGVKVVPGVFEDTQGEWLRWVDADGNVLLTGDEQVAVERQKAAIERQKAEEAVLRAERLAEKLRELGIDPDA